ncbi:ESX secretion-associated protein EspG [Pseudonocardiaceae bacterium YIM PH 21723]|nr:ESX secretion-associated protein EspG [Pseudonocardiaceae bacterium YIM PH 21723]
MLRGNITVSRLAWDVVRQRHGVEEQHHVLAVEHGSNVAGGDEVIIRDAYAELERIGLGQGYQAHPDLVSTIALLSRPMQELHGWFGHQGRGDNLIGFVAATDGRDAALATLDEHNFHVVPIAPDRLPEAVARLLPDSPPSPGRSLTMPVELLDGVTNNKQPERPRYPQDDEDGDGQSWMVGATKQEDPDLRAIKELLKQPRRGLARIYAAGRDQMGRRAKTSRPLLVLDTEQGRWLMQVRPERSGQEWAVVLPAGRERIEQAAQQMLATLQPH